MTEVTGSEALAWGALEAGVQVVTGYPGTPVTATVDALARLAPPGIRVEWNINERSAFDIAFGASLAGIRSLVCFKSVGLNVALDSLMTANLSSGEGGFVILTGDDPGGWGSQNEEDCRPIIAAAEVPLLEPSTPAEARRLMQEAFELSERACVPVVVRITRAFVKQMGPLDHPLTPAHSLPAAHFERQTDRWTVLPIHVVDYHLRLKRTLAHVQAEFEGSDFNQVEGDGSIGIIVAGHMSQKLAEVLSMGCQPPLRILHLGTLHPLPEKKILAFLRQVQGVLVVEEIAPFIETAVQAIAQRSGLTLPVFGRSSGHLPQAGEVFTPHIAKALASYIPEWACPELELPQRAMISREPLCEGCPYIPAFTALLSMMERYGGRESFIVTGESGCMIRGQLPPFQLLDVKFALGSSLGLATGIAKTGLPQRVIALSGDSSFLHTGLLELIDAVQSGVDLLVVLLDNGTSAISGGQPHPGTVHDLQGRSRRPADLTALARAAGVEQVRTVDPFDLQATEKAYEEALLAPGVSLVVVKSPCIFYLPEELTNGVETTGETRD